MSPAEEITREEFLSDRHGKTFADVVHDARTPFDEVREFFNDADRQQRMEDSEIHHDRAPLAGVVRELESEPAVHRFFAMRQRRRSARLRQAIGVLVRMIMERRGWQTTGKKGSLGVRGSPELRSPYHNMGGLALWFIRAERYQRESGMRFRSVRERCEEFVVAETDETTVTDPAEGEDVPSSRRNGPVS
ncbi:MAG: hypothetical protein ACYST0_08245 [Planctomycetota bacterium]|jgi:hypothetical protein